MLKVWSEKELTLQSGRVIWRQCPSTPGVWEYKEIQKFSRVVSGSRGSTWESGQESEPGAEHLKKFESRKKVEAQLQASLKKGCLPLSSSTKLLEEAAALAKAARELSHLEARAPSVASSKKSRK